MSEQEIQNKEVRVRIGINISFEMYKIIESLREDFGVKDCAEIFRRALALLYEVNELQKKFVQKDIALCILGKRRKPKEIIILKNLSK
ncbi:MAG: hypothetical protein L3J07_03805 [Candidatus Magasanikbacteria bacterium]|nr:hypothetical protein [Candidatus Magasanikbacteria bacterium]